MLLAGPISHTSTQYIDFVNFFTFQWICLPIILFKMSKTALINFTDFNFSNHHAELHYLVDFSSYL